MTQAYVDTYLVVLQTIDSICGTHAVVKQKLLVKELHTALKHLYTDGVIPHLHSCLVEIITTSILRYEQMGLVEVSSYGNKQGNNTAFLISNSEMKPKIEDNLRWLHSSRAFTAKQLQAIGESVNDAIMQVQGLVPIAKL